MAELLLERDQGVLGVPCLHVAACVGLHTVIFWVDAQHLGLCAGWALLHGRGAWAAVVVSGLCGLMDRSCGLRCWRVSVRRGCCM